MESDDKSNATAMPQSSPTTEEVASNAVAKTRELNTYDASASDNQFFFEDEVFCIDKKGSFKFGMIIETCDSYDEDDDEEIVRKGQVRVAWYPHCKEEVLSERDIGLVDRTLMPGDVVRRLAAGHATQSGYVLDVKVRADVRVLKSRYVLKNVKSDRLTSVMTFPRDVVVCLDSWVGTTKVTEDRVIMRTTYGARIEVPSQVFWAFEDYDARNLHGIYEPVIMFPGNILVGRLPSADCVVLLTPDKPLRKNRRGKPLTERYIVESVTADSAWVNWQCKALTDDKDVLEQPDPIVTGEDLNRLKYVNYFEACMQQIGDRNFMNFEEGDELVNKSDWELVQALKYKLIYEIQQSDEHQSLYINAGGATSASVAPTGSSYHGHDKLKKKLSQLDGDKTTAKAKRLSFHLTSPTTPGSKEKNLEKILKVSGVSDPLKSTTATKDGNENSSWLTEDEDETDDNDVDVDVDVAADEDEETDIEIAGSDILPLHMDRDSDDSSVRECSVTGSTGSGCNGAKNANSDGHTFKCISVQQQNNWRRNFITHSLKKLRKFAKYAAPKTRLENINVGDKIATETLLVYSQVTVVWQDGTVENDIDSIELYPIHHLDNNEVFPGDFVISATAPEDVNFRNYGMVQKVDHHGRTAIVKWFSTYNPLDEPKPIYKGETEESLYDLKEHPDFAYRAGVMVIRVANFVGDDEICTAGQIIDCLPETGQVKVKWVDGHVSSCWPQDVFEVGNHVQNDWANDSEDSWETASTRSDSSQKISAEGSDILINIERARVAVERLAEMFHHNPNMEGLDAMRKLLCVYKCCRYLDRLLGTSYFHENNFRDFIECVRRCPNISEAQDCKNRLFNESQASPTTNDAPTPLLYEGQPSSMTLTQQQAKDKPSSYCEVLSFIASTSQRLQVEYSPLKNASSAERNQLINTALINIERAFEKTSLLKAVGNSAKSKSHDDSGNCSRNENCDISLTNLEPTTSISNVSPKTEGTVDPNSILDEITPQIMCLRLCSFLKDQLIKCIDGIRYKYYTEDSFVIEMDMQSAIKAVNEAKKAVLKENSVEVEIETTVFTEPTSKTDDVTECNKKIDVDLDKATDDVSLDLPISPNICPDCFQVVPNTPTAHKFFLTIFHANEPQQFHKAVAREHRILASDLPEGVWVRVYEDRMDLLSIMMEGPRHTPYEGGLFLFDLQLSRDYPKSPPLCHYICFCADRLNPNLYEDGKVCVSLLGTWSGRDTEVWGPSSSLLQLIVSIQGLILVPEPYFNEAGYEKQKGTQQGKENSQMYNEMAIIKMIQATTKLIQQPPEIFHTEILEYYEKHGTLIYERVKGWMELSQLYNDNNQPNSLDNKCLEDYTPPEFPLIPGSRGFCKTLSGLLENFKTKLSTMPEKKNLEKSE